MLNVTVMASSVIEFISQHREDINNVRTPEYEIFIILVASVILCGREPAV